jgi:hypothetical protein
MSAFEKELEQPEASWNANIANGGVTCSPSTGSREELQTAGDVHAPLADIPGRPKLALFPDSIQARLESTYVAARFCGNLGALTIIQEAAGKEQTLSFCYYWPALQNEGTIAVPDLLSYIAHYQRASARLLSNLHGKRPNLFTLTRTPSFRLHALSGSPARSPVQEPPAPVVGKYVLLFFSAQP